MFLTAHSFHMCWARSGQRAHRYARAMLAGFPRLIRRLSHSLPGPSPLLFVLIFISSLQASRENHWHDDWLQILPDGTHVSSTRFPVAMFSRGMQLTTAAVRAPEAEASVALQRQRAQRHDPQPHGNKHVLFVSRFFTNGSGFLFVARGLTHLV